MASSAAPVVSSGVLAPLPTTERGVAAVISAAGDLLAYGSGNVVIVRSLADPSLSLAYCEHTGARPCAFFRARSAVRATPQAATELLRPRARAPPSRRRARSARQGRAHFAHGQVRRQRRRLGQGASRRPDGRAMPRWAAAARATSTPRAWTPRARARLSAAPRARALARACAPSCVSAPPPPLPARATAAYLLPPLARARPRAGARVGADAGRALAEVRAAVYWRRGGGPRVGLGVQAAAGGRRRPGQGQIFCVGHWLVAGRGRAAQQEERDVRL